MLLLKRQAGQSITIGNEIEVKLLAVDNLGNTRIGIEAPKSLKIDRKEVKDYKEREVSRKGNKS